MWGKRLIVYLKVDWTMVLSVLKELLPQEASTASAEDKLRLTLIFLSPKVPATAGAERNKRKNNKKSTQ